ncbi:hypothetical protein QQ045_013974 [Rhodiola kirilowii]
MSATKSDLDLPGFRFHPTEDELLEFYLKKILSGKTLPYSVIGFLNIYLHDPWQLPDLAKIGEREWYFFVPRDRKLGTGGRPNRTTVNGFWKATGSDRRIFSLSDPKRVIGLKKTLVFYTGRAPRGCKTDWVMNEYRLPERHHRSTTTSSASSQDIVLCKVYRKATSLKVLEQRAAMDHDDEVREIAPTPQFSLPLSNEALSVDFEKMLESMKEEEEEVGTAAVVEMDEEEAEGRSDDVSNSRLNFPVGMDLLADLEVPKSDVDWTQDQFWTQFNSPWLMNLTPSYVNVLNL